MQPTHRDLRLPTKGWPLWALGAVAPVVLALGFVGGMALATYLPRGAKPPATAQTVPSVPTPPPAKAPQQPATPAPSYIPSIRDFRRYGDWEDGTLPVPGPRTNNLPTPPETTRAGEPPKDIREARQELVRAFGRLQIGNRVIPSIDYQQMRNAGESISVVGMIRASDYATWTAIQQENPEQLQAWLENVARRVQAAAIRDRFWLSWAVVEVLPDKPSGFASYEVTPLVGGTFLVVRPLAATMDPADTTVSLRAPVGDSPEAGQRPPGSSPWATYGPVIRFDSTDLYRPAGLAGTRPQ